ncbi:MAG: ABC transporter permease, partial [Acidobacteria bacterium]|nr:ABC transporter permease [Acidobacteriota bacterium]
MQPAVFRFLVRRMLHAVLLVLTVSSAAMVLVHLAPGDSLLEIGGDPAVAAAERARLGLDRPFIAQYSSWLRRAAVLDFGESVRFRRPVRTLLRERIPNTILLGSLALLLAIALGVPAGVVTGGAPRHWWARTLAAASLLLVATPPLVTALTLLLLAALTGWLPAGGFDPRGANLFEVAAAGLRYLPLPVIALGLPIAASIERLQSAAIVEVLGEPCLAAARARGISLQRATWVHALRLSLTPVLGVMGIVIGTVLS